VVQTVKPADAGVSVGQVFQGKYRVDAILGQGGMGVVAECTHLALNERVAVKMLRQDVLLDQDAVARFIREAQAACRLKSEYVARVSDVGTFENGVPYMVMEFLEGHDLGELLSQRGVLPVQWAVELMLQTAEALAEAHSLSIVHRDVKPTNLFVTWRPDGTALIKVLDFGISKSPMGTDMNLTQTQSLLGTPAYMSPEQMRSARLVDTRTDIWSLGTVFYEILEGRRPFEAESFSEMCVKVAVDPPAPMVNTPPGLQQVILRCLAKSPEQRYATMAELGRDLVPYAADPHGAQMLVDRMARMLRRSAHVSHDWEGGGTGVGGTGPARGSAPDLGSGPVRAQTPGPQQWGQGSDPAASPWNVKSNPNAQPWHGSTPRGDASQPFARPISDGSQPFPRVASDESSQGYVGTTLSTRKRRWPLLLILLGGLAAGGAAIALAMSGGHEQAATTQAADDTSDTVELETVPAPPAPTQTGSDSAPTQTGSDSTPTQTASDPAQPGPTAVFYDRADATPSDKPTLDPKKVIVDTKANPRADKKAASTKRGTSRSVKSVKTDRTQKASAGASGLIDPNGDATKDGNKPAEKRCDVWNSMHGCASK
jgi:serine/threonine-protein kinase